MDLIKKTEAGVYMIAEMSGNHNGSKDRAIEIINKAKESGADCVKIQTYTPDTITIDCDNKYFKIDDGTWKGENLYSLYGKAFTPWEWQADLKKEADRIGIDFLSTPFDNTSVDFLESIGLEFYKIASFELIDLPLIRYIAKKKKPIIISTGMSTKKEIEEAVECIKKYGDASQLILLKCCSAYPAVSDDMNIATIDDMRAEFNLPVGLSDHTLGDLSAILAVAKGARVIEKHFCMDRSEGGPDSSFSMEPDEYKQMVLNIRDAEKALGTVKYGPSKNEETNICFRRSLFVVEDIAEGEIFTEKNVRSIRPGYGLLPKYYDDVIGKKAVVSAKRGTPLSKEMIQGFN